MQRTLKKTVEFSGIGLHTGVPVRVEVRPAPAGTGIVFVREDLPGCPRIAATPHAVFDTTLATRIGTPEAFVSTVEHFMSALYGFGIDNAVVSVDNYELPILDGSAAPFLVVLDEAGVEELKAPRSFFVVKSAVEVVDPKNPKRFIRVEPSKKAIISYSIDFEVAKAIGRQALSLPLDGESFLREFAFARTFCLFEEVEYMKSRGLARGGSLDNAIVVSRADGVLNTNGLRDELEFVRHCVGDLALMGMPVLGHIIAHKAGHDLHTALARKLLDEREQHKVVVEGGREGAIVRGLARFPSRLSDVGASLLGARLVTG
jgi:UDP-3-O-[3-hydroxymyristoyl] N-acetylglucosamine deacetylase